MTLLSLALVLTAAVLHAVWNLAAKRAGGGLPFVFATGLVINALYLPVLVVYVLLQPPSLSLGAIGVIVVSAALKTAYALSLQRGYRTGDFSLIYPLARGTGPLLSVLLAIVLLGERPSVRGIAGALLIVAGIFFLTGGAILSPLGYVLILTAMTFTPVSYVAPAREASILIGTYLGARLFKEAQGTRRLGASACIVSGIVLLALA